MHPNSVLHIPHSSTRIPPEERRSLHLSDQALQTELIKMTDWYTDELFNIGTDAVIPIIFPVSRLIVDPERFEDDALEVMVAKGMGVIYTRASDGDKLREPLEQYERDQMLKAYYWPHHAKLNSEVTIILEKRGKALIIDCHSFPSKPHQHETHQSKSRPDICIGTDPFHTPDWLTESIRSGFLNRGYSVEINRPFSGALVPINFYQKDRAISSIMIEINRRLYLNEDTGHKRSSLFDVKNDIDGVVASLINTFNEQNLE
jgi:N-formylglutamate deformylase